MGLKPGYKQTEVGVIPEDWLVTKLGHHVTFKTGPFGSALHKSDYVHDGVPVINPMQIIEGKIVPTESMAISDQVARKLTEFRLSAGDIVIGRRGEMGRCAFVDKEQQGWLCGTGSMIIRASNLIDARFLQRILSSFHVVATLENSSVGSTMINLNQGVLGRLVIALPPSKAEQEVIAEALSDADALIESLEQLIAKKRDIKQGAMHELLAGKRRLGEFASLTTRYKRTDVGEIPKDWDTPELTDILKSMQLGGNYKNSERETSWPLIKMGNLGRGNIKFDKLEFIDSTQIPSERDRLGTDDVLLNTRNTLDLVGKVAIWRDELPEAYFNSNILRMKFDERRVSSYRFMNYILNTSSSLRALRGIAIGTTSVAAIYGRDLVKVKIPLPTKAEQESIAEALSDMDSLIESLQTKLTKARAIKQGMMSELLTGKTRLV